MNSLLLALIIAAGTPGAVDQAVATPAAKADPDQKMRCKTEEVTGSLAGRRRTCHTVAEWRKLEDDAARDATAAVDHGVVSCGDCRRD